MSQHRLLVAVPGQLLAVAVWGIVGSMQIAAAATFNVNSTLDEVDANPGDGTCASLAGNCTLRAAVQEANADAGADAIVIPRGVYVLRIFGRGEDGGAKGDLDVTDDAAITGAGKGKTVIRGHMDDGIISVLGTANVSISGVTISRGLGGFFGGVYNEGTLVLSDVAVSRNHAESPTTGAGGIYNNGTVTLTGVDLTRNRADAMTSAGGLVNFGSATVARATIARNRADVGAVIDFGPLAISEATLSENIGGPCGGIAVYTGTVDLTNVTITHNRSRGGGSVLSGALSGGIDTEPASTVNLTNVTLADSLGPPGQIVYGIACGGGAVTLTNTLVANDFHGVNCYTNDLRNPITSGGHNLDTDGSCFLASTGDQAGTAASPINPLLRPLAKNGGLAKTRALRATSPAIDAGDNTACPATDERGQPRPADGNGDSIPICDIGAYELQP